MGFKPFKLVDIIYFSSKMVKITELTNYYLEKCPVPLTSRFWNPCSFWFNRNRKERNRVGGGGGPFQVFLISFNHGSMGHFKESLLRIYTFGEVRPISCTPYQISSILHCLPLFFHQQIGMISDTSHQGRRVD